jgi:sterol 3beta-glucosyltransferase/vancomycin aglycone glucosyltransferase
MAKCGVRVWNSLIVRARVRIGIQTWGSEGDIRPFVALGHALASRGHEVEMLYTEVSDRRYDAVARALGFTARAVASPIVQDEAQLLAIGLKIINTRDQLQQGLLIARHMLEPVMPQMYEAGLELAKRSDLLIHHFILHAARAAADVTGTPAITVAFAHMLVPSREITPTGMPRLGPWANVLGWKIARSAVNFTLLKDANRMRNTLGLRPFRDLMDEGWASHRLHLLASSPALLDRPADWPAWNQMCGFLELPPHEHEPVAPEVEAFLSRGPAPVFMGFGSLMPMGGTDHLTEAIGIFTDAARQAGQRAIIQAEIDVPATSDVLFVRRTPHAQVFPRCAAVVHHAGAGTTHSTLRAGVPSIAVPHVSDQFAWSAELQRLGVAPPPLRRTKWSASTLAARIREVIATPQMKAAAVAIQKRMASDDGPTTAAKMIEQAMR